MGIERQNGNPVLWCQAVEKAPTLLEQAEQPSQTMSLETLLDDEAINRPRTPPRGGRPVLVVPTDRVRVPRHPPEDRFNTSRLAVDADDEVGRLQAQQGPTRVVDDPRVDENAGNVYTLYIPRLGDR